MISFPDRARFRSNGKIRYDKVYSEACLGLIDLPIFFFFFFMNYIQSEQAPCRSLYQEIQVLIVNPDYTVSCRGFLVKAHKLTNFLISSLYHYCIVSS